MKEKIFEFIITFQKENTYYPSYDEIANYVGLKSKASVYDYIMKLEKDEYLEIKGTRSYKILKRKRGIKKCLTKYIRDFLKSDTS